MPSLNMEKMQRILALRTVEAMLGNVYLEKPKRPLPDGTVINSPIKMRVLHAIKGCVVQMVGIDQQGNIIKVANSYMKVVEELTAIGWFDMVDVNGPVADFLRRDKESSSLTPSNTAESIMALIDSKAEAGLRQVTLDEAKSCFEDIRMIVKRHTKNRMRWIASSESCSLGVGCDEAGECYAIVNQKPNWCPKRSR